MKVILLDNIKGVGFKDQIIDANDGYARNFLIPKGKAIEANTANLAKLKSKQDSNAYKKSVEKQEAEARDREREQHKFVDDVMEVGQRVFHEQMGIGHITDVMNVGESIMYTIDFGKLGKKAMDASYAKLKKF